MHTEKEHSVLFTFTLCRDVRASEHLCFFPLSLYHFSFHLVSLPFTSLPYHHGHMKCCHYSTRCFHTEVLHTTRSFRKNWGDSHTCSHSLEWDELHISDSWEAIDAAPEIVSIFYAPALVISVAGGIMFSVRPSAHPSVRLIIVNAVSQECLERTLSHLAQMSSELITIRWSKVTVTLEFIH